MEYDWDLHAVVRGCTSTTATATTAASSSATATDSTSCGQLFTPFEQDCSFSAPWFQDLLEPRRESFIEELHDLCKPFFPKPQEPSQIVLLPPQSLPISPLSVLGGLQDLSPEQQQQQQQQRVIKQLPQHVQQKQQLFSVVNSSSKASPSHFPSPRSKKRKNHLKKVCHVPAESLSSDMWSWRKYGQKPIKGSPYPRGYYRCSTSKGCMARKQVERNRSDPGMFIVTYTAEHNHPMPTHRNSLAGSTRQKPSETANSDDPKKASCSPEMSTAASLSPAPDKLESSREDLAEAEDDDDDGFSVSNMALDDDFFAGLEDLTGHDNGECLSDQFPATSQFPWLANNATTTTTAGGGG